MNFFHDQTEAKLHISNLVNYTSNVDVITWEKKTYYNNNFSQLYLFTPPSLSVLSESDILHTPSILWAYFKYSQSMLENLTLCHTARLTDVTSHVASGSVSGSSAMLTAGSVVIVLVLSCELWPPWAARPLVITMSRQGRTGASGVRRRGPEWVDGSRKKMGLSFKF